MAVVGAGAAGIAAARAALARGLTVSVLEARDRVGGRAFTASFGGHPVDLGAHWLHAGRVNPLVRLARARNAPLRTSADSPHIALSGRLGSPAERAAYGRAFDRVDRAIAAAARGCDDASLEQAFPPLGRWRSAARSTFALISGRPLPEASAKDFPSEEFADNHFVRGGYGALVSRLAAGLPIALGAAVEAIDWSGRGVRVRTARGTVRARAAIVTVPVPVLAQNRIRFTPALPEALACAISALLPGVYEHVVLNWPDAPFGGADRLAKLVSARTSFGMMTWMDDAPFHYLELDYRTVAEARRDSARLARLARALLTEQFGPRALDQLRVLTVTDWWGDPWSQGAWAVAPPGGAHARLRLSCPAGDRIWFAGEASVGAMWGTVGGAWDAGEKAALEVGAALGRSRVGSARPVPVEAG